MSHFPFSYLFSFVSTKIGKNPVFDILLGNQTSRSGCFIFTDVTLITRQKGLHCYMEHTLSRIYIYFLQNLIFIKSFKVVQLLVNGKLMLELYFMIWYDTFDACHKQKILNFPPISVNNFLLRIGVRHNFWAETNFLTKSYLFA